jgi:hypothetical protein
MTDLTDQNELTRTTPIGLSKKQRKGTHAHTKHKKKKEKAQSTPSKNNSPS